MHTTTALPDDVRAWIEEVTAAELTGAVRRPGGGRNEGWLIELTADGTPSRAFLRWDRSDPAVTGDPWTVRREAEVYRALSATDVPTARFIGLHPTRQAVLLDVVDGDGRFGLIADPARATAISQDFMQCLARLHRLDVVELGLAAPGRTIADHVRDQLDEIDALLAFRGGVPVAELGIARAWLRANVPDADGPPVLVQGDTGPGNFMFADDRVTAIVDWELAHPGDPMDDLAWVSLRSVQEPFPDLEDRFADYEQASGHRIDLARIRYYRVLAEAKIMAMGHTGPDTEATANTDAGAAHSGGDVGARLIFGQLHRRLLVEALLDATGMDVDAGDGVVPDASADDEPAEWHGLYEAVLGQLRDVITPRIDDGFALQRTKGVARIVKYLQAADRHGRTFAAAELDDLAAALGTRPSSPRVGRRQLAAAVHEGRIDPAVALRVVRRRVARDEELLRGASGVFASRHYDPLTRFAGA